MKQLTENQQQLIAKITEEFMAMNDYPKPTSFADILLDEINQTKRDFEAIEIKNRAIYAELSKQFEQDMKYLISECEKLGIEVDCDPLHRNPGSDYCGETVWFGKTQGHDERFTISAKAPTLFRAKNGLRQYELMPTLSYFIRTIEYPSLDGLMKGDTFKNAITQLYHKLNR